MWRCGRHLVALVLLGACATTALAKKKKEEEPDVGTEGLPGDAGDLVDFLGVYVFEALNTPKYRFYVYMMTGYALNKQGTIAFISTTCNVLYGYWILKGFLGSGPLGSLPRTRMLLFTLLTLYVGPAMVLLVLGAAGAIVGCFAFYPMRSVMAMWSYFFLTSKAWHALGVRLGLDQDKDGDVDLSDVIKWASMRPWGRALRLHVLHAALNHDDNPIETILRKLDRLDSKLDVASPPMTLGQAKQRL